MQGARKRIRREQMAFLHGEAHVIAHLRPTPPLAALVKEPAQRGTRAFVLGHANGFKHLRLKQRPAKKKAKLQKAAPNVGQQAAIESVERRSEAFARLGAND